MWPTVVVAGRRQIRYTMSCPRPSSTFARFVTLVISTRHWPGRVDVDLAGLGQASQCPALPTTRMSRPALPVVSASPSNKGREPLPHLGPQRVTGGLTVDINQNCLLCAKHCALANY